MSRGPLRRPANRRGLTLLEVMLAIGLLVLVSGMLFMFYDAMLRAREYGRKAATDGYLARTIAEQIAEEVRSAAGFVPAIGPGISGTDRLLTIQTVAIPDKTLFRRLSIKDQRLPAEADIRQVQYYLAYDEDVDHTYADGIDAAAPLGLVRREVRTLYRPRVQLEGVSDGVDLDLLAPELKYVRFRYFDGVDWLDKWDIGQDPEGQTGNSLPQAVEITVGYTELPPPEEEDDQAQEDEAELVDSDLTPSEPEPYSEQTFTTMIRIPQADAFFQSRGMRGQRRSRLSQSEGR